MGRATSSPTSFTRFAGIAIAAIASGALLAFQGPASAEVPPAAAAAQPVTYGDLDLSSPADARTLMRRIHKAAVRACGDGPVHTPLNPRASHDFHVCTIDAKTAAVTAINAPLLTALNDKGRISDSTSLAAR